jgi:hypothetical protein
MSRDWMLEREMAFVQVRVTSSHPARGQPMPIVTMANSLAEKAHQWLALDLLRSATGILRCARRRYLRGEISRTGLQVALSAANLTQRMAALLVLGPKQFRCRRDNHWTTGDGQ